MTNIKQRKMYQQGKSLNVNSFYCVLLPVNVFESFLQNREECRDVPKQQCQQKEEEICEEIPKTTCKIIPKTSCTTKGDRQSINQCNAI